MNWHFHWTLYSPCNRPRLLAMIEANYGHVNRFIRRQISSATGKMKPQQELLRLCRENEVDAAVSLLEKHIEQTQKSLRAMLRHR